MATMIRMLAPADGKHGTLTVNGRTYTAALGATVDVPDFDAAVLAANGWTQTLRGASVGATTARPVSPTGGPFPTQGQLFMDTTVGAVIVFDGLIWRDSTTGAAV